MWGKIFMLFQEVLIDLPETPDEPFEYAFRATFVPVCAT